MRFVLDASVALAWFLPEENPANEEYAHGVLRFMRQRLAFAVVPSAWHEEVAAVLIRRRRSEDLSQRRFDDALQLIAELPIESHMNAYTVAIIVERARRYHLQGFDALYFDLAYVLGLPIAALDGGLRTAARAHGVKLFAA